MMNSDTIKAQAAKLGFQAVGICSAEVSPDNSRRLAEFLSHGRHGDMIWMESRAAERGNPKQLWSDVKSIIMLGMSYGPAIDPLQNHKLPEVGIISVYAQGRDYHDVVKSRLKQLARWLVDQHGGDVKVFVDTAPVMEKSLAAAAGIGWQGKHTNLVSRRDGSWLFLGAIYSTHEISLDKPHDNRCGTCNACQDVCPTQAFSKPYQLDARRCISYLTIEHKADIPLEFRKAIGNRIYGCDDCLAVCPWNKFAATSKEIAFQPREALIAPTLVALSELDDPGFRTFFSGSPIKRIGRDRFLRNVMIALGNALPTDIILAAVVARLTDSSTLVRAAAVWALGELQQADPEQLAAWVSRFAQLEQVPSVQAEWARLQPRM